MGDPLTALTGFDVLVLTKAFVTTEVSLGITLIYHEDGENCHTTTDKPAHELECKIAF